MSVPQACPAEHPHSSTTRCYLQHRCRCDVCRAGMARRMADRRRAIAYGTHRPARTAAGPVRDHLNALRGAGMGMRTISAASGVPMSTVCNIVWAVRDSDGVPRLRRQVGVGVAEALLAVQSRLEVMPDGAIVDGRGTRRRLQALACLGWSRAALSRRISVGEHNLQRIANAERVLAGTARMISALYAELWDQRPMATNATEAEMIARAMRLARTAGWVPPLAWDDIDEDDAPAATEPDGDVDIVAIELAIAGERVNLTTAERHEAVRALNARGYYDSEIATMTGVDARTILRDRRALDLPAVDERAREELLNTKALAA